MTNDEILDIANDMAFMACIWIKDDSNEFKDMVHFAKLVANAASAKAVKSERKECVALCKSIAAKSSINTFPKALECAEAIQARGKQTLRGEA